ncbi:MAG: hypothetical protein HY659_05825 [Rhizobiales bacterium]|nr:hypothetical protein [Hyphomicrobiales bacterium]
MTAGLFVLGMLITAVGVAMVGFGIPINEFSLGNTLIIAGTVAVVGGLLLVGLAAAVRQLSRLIEAQAAKPAPRANRPADSFEAAPPRDIGSPRSAQSRPYPQSQRLEHQSHDPRLSEPRFVPVSVDALEEHIMERPRPAFPSSQRPDSHLHEPMEEAPLSPRVAPSRGPARVAGPGMTEFPLEPKGWSPNAARPAPAPRNGSAEPVRMPAPERQAPHVAANERWLNGGQQPVPPEAPNHGRDPVPTRSRDDSASAGHRASASQSATVSQQTSERRPAAILKSGVVDGMAYTLYTDGSIEAELAEGVVRFGSIDELRTHLEKSA